MATLPVVFSAAVAWLPDGKCSGRRLSAPCFRSVAGRFGCRPTIFSPRLRSAWLLAAALASDAIPGVEIVKWVGGGDQAMRHLVSCCLNL